MKKSTKIIITVIVGVLLISSIVLNVVLAVECGIIKEPKNLSGSVNESWQKNDAYITYNNIDYNKYYSANRDYISHIDFQYDDDYSVDGPIYYYEISYAQNFSWSDDLEVYFVLETTNGERFATGIEKSHTDTTDDEIYFSCPYTHSELHIAEVWVRTEN